MQEYRVHPHPPPYRSTRPLPLPSPLPVLLPLLLPLTTPYAGTASTPPTGTSESDADNLGRAWSLYGEGGVDARGVLSVLLRVHGEDLRAVWPQVLASLPTNEVRNTLCRPRPRLRSNGDSLSRVFTGALKTLACQVPPMVAYIVTEKRCKSLPLEYNIMCMCTSFSHLWGCEGLSFCGPRRCTKRVSTPPPSPH